jgi:hypothetical protein
LPTSVCRPFIRGLRAVLHLRRALPQMNGDLAFRPLYSQRDPLMMRWKCQQAVFALSFAVHCNPLATRADIHFPGNFLHPHVLAGTYCQGTE